jgi:L-phenylalanine/L-methionine N-acetyltransferase
MKALIRRPVVADVPGLMAGVSRPEVFGGLLQMPFPSDALWRQRIEDAAKGPATELSLVAEQDGQIVGNAGLHSVGPSPRRGHARSLGIWVLPEAQGQGIGRALMEALIDSAENWMGVRRLELVVNADNARAIALYRRCGFELEGTHRAYALRDGQWVDCLAMARLRPGSA